MAYFDRIADGATFLIITLIGKHKVQKKISRTRVVDLLNEAIQSLNILINYIKYSTFTDCLRRFHIMATNLDKNLQSGVYQIMKPSHVIRSHRPFR